MVDLSEDYEYNNLDEINAFIAIKNPFRYRSYYYDFETNLYYLNSRYYDPEIGRFINADDVTTLDLTQVVLNGLNLYAYCLNNPINQADENGYFGWLLGILIGAIIGAVVNTAFEVANQVQNYGWDLGDWDWGQIGLSALGGLVAGAISAIPIPGFQSFGIWGSIIHYGLTFLTGGVGAVAGGLISGAVDSVESAFTSFAIGGTFNLFSDLLTNGLNKLIQKYSNKVLTNPLYADMTLGDLVGSGLKSYPKYLSSLMNKLSRAIRFANGGLTRSIFYNIGINSVFEIISGFIN